jgi:hypothetical protein
MRTLCSLLIGFFNNALTATEVTQRETAGREARGRQA